jgi:hypothetical protein
MAVLRKIALGLLLAAAAGVLVMATWELWNYQQRANFPLPNRVDLLAKRVGDMELLVLLLLGTSGLYAIVFAISSHFSATSFARQADQTIGHIQDQIGLMMGDLRELQGETEAKLGQITAPTPAAANPAGWEAQIAEMTARAATYQDQPLSEHDRLEVMQDECMAAYLEVVAYAHGRTALAGLYLEFGRIYASLDPARSRFYLERALRMAVPESAIASEIHYQLACRYAAAHAFPHAMRELTAAFEHQFKTLEEKLASDIEEGGQLYELASTAPFDKSVNDLLLNMSIGIG